MQEIERKFLVKNKDFKPSARQVIAIQQGYLNLDPEKTVRIRIKDDTGVLTIKGRGSTDGMERFEWETPVELNEARALLNLCDKDHIITKKRFIVPFKGKTWEVDSFSGKNQGLIVAEIELENRTDHVQLPSWCGKEVTGDKRFYNLQLAKDPYKNWPQENN